jgi:hypothetical protein
MIVVDKNSVYEEELKPYPYLFPNNSTQIYPGEKIFIEVEQDNGVIKKMTAVKENINPKKTLTISFTQVTEKGVHKSMQLTIANPFAQKLFYKATIYIYNQQKWALTDVLPVQPGLLGIEIWPDIITSITLGNWEFKN